MREDYTYLSDGYRLMSNQFGVFLQRNRNTKAWRSVKAKAQWTTLGAWLWVTP